LSICVANSRNGVDVFKAMQFGTGTASVWGFAGALRSHINATDWCAHQLGEFFDVSLVRVPVFTSTCIVTFACERNSIGLYVNGLLCFHTPIPVWWSSAQMTFDVRNGPWYLYVTLQHLYLETNVKAAFERVTLERVPTTTSELYGHWHAFLGGFVQWRNRAGLF
jgi:hypothetical protein